MSVMSQAWGAVRLFWSLAVAESMTDRQVIEVESVGGGNYARAWRITLDGPPHALVGRRLPARSLTPVATVNQLLERCRTAALPSPIPVWARGTASVGVQSQLLTWIDGCTAPPEPSVEVSVLADALTKIAKVDSRGLELPDFPRLPSPRWQDRIRRRAVGRAALDLLLAQPTPALDGGLVHGDLCQANLLWRDEELVGIIDWDRASRGPIGVDIAMVWTDLVIRHGVPVANSLLRRLKGGGGDLHGLRYWQLRMVASSLGGETAADVTARLAEGLEHLTG
jgi:aminoglycoside phosphotransferase (APT) family kinase protein